MKVPSRVLVVLFGITCVRTNASFAQSGWFQQNPRAPTGNDLYVVATPDSNTVVALGAAGTIVRSTDSGATWTLESSGTLSFLGGVSFVDANTGTAVGEGGIILLTNTGGE
jgi:photosystem II stability/assembly factor-like uncharacterized protein